MYEYKETPSGKYIKTSHSNGDYWAFLPYPLPPKINYDNELMYLGMEAQRYLSELGVRCKQLPNSTLFISAYLRKEAEFSCQIEGTKASIKDVIEDEAGIKNENAPQDKSDIINYLHALDKGINMLKDMDINLWFIRSLHQELLQHQQEKEPGKFRETQNQVGGIEYHPSTADYVPPPPFEMEQALRDLELYIKGNSDLPPLIKIALVHAQFETIHPFKDGNGRLGRILITLQLFKEKIIEQPVLYLSYYLKKHKDEYDSNLQSLHDKGTWEIWLKFFLKAIIETSKDAIRLTNEIDTLASTVINILVGEFGETKGSSYSEVIYYFFLKPVFSAKDLLNHFENKSKRSIYNALKDFEKTGVIKEITKSPKNKKYAFVNYLKILNSA